MAVERTARETAEDKIAWDVFLSCFPSALAQRIRERSDTLLDLARRVLDENQKINLTGARDFASLFHDHVLDSLTLAPWIVERADKPEECQLLVDVGSGGGFPALPLAVVFPRMKILCIESVGKKARALGGLCAAFSFSRVTVLAERAESAARDPRWREKADWATARAVGSLPTVCELCLPFLRVGGFCLAQRGASAEAEAAAAQRPIARLGGRVDRLAAVGPPSAVRRHFIVLIEKIAPSPDEYPRRPGLPAKRPLGG